jgi:hypothetical protein
MKKYIIDNKINIYENKIAILPSVLERIGPFIFILKNG